LREKVGTAFSQEATRQSSCAIAQPPNITRSIGVGMGVRNYLIEGVSGAGKTAVATELGRRGYQAIHGDRELAYRGDPETGLPVAPPTYPPTAIWISDHHIWDVEKVKACIANRDEPVTFFCGGSRNSSKFIHLLDGVFVLEVDRDSMNRRIAERVALDPTDFGGKPEEREVIARAYATKEHVPKNATSIDATAPIARVVDDILSKCGKAEPGRARMPRRLDSDRPLPKAGRAKRNMGVQHE
jgi:hypothetical protein